MGELSPEARRAIDEALARIPPEARRVPTGVSALAVDYIWSGNKLIAKDPDHRGWKNNPLDWGWRKPRDQSRGTWTISEAKRARIRADREAGQSVLSVADAHGVSPSTVRRIVGGPPYRRQQPIDRAAVRQDLIAGFTAREVAQQNDCSIGSVRRLARQMGITIVPAVPIGLTGDALTARIVAMADGTRTAPQIARALGCSARAVSARRDSHGLDIPLGRAGAPRKVAA